MPALEGAHLPTEARKWLATIHARLLEADEVRPGVVIVIDFENLNTIFANSGSSFTAMLSNLEFVERDTWRLFISRAQQGATFREQIRERALDVEVRHAGIIAEGLAFALTAGGVAVSTSHDPPWDSPTVQVDVDRLGPSGGVETKVGIEIAHVSDPLHWTFHEAAVLFPESDRTQSIDDLWPSLSARFTRVRFTRRVKSQLSALDEMPRLAVLDRIVELQMALRRWDQKSERQPIWGSNVSPESATRRKHCWFENDDGNMAEYSTHARFTPGAGRIHFRFLDGDSLGKIEIGYVGPKLGV